MDATVRPTKTPPTVIISMNDPDQRARARASFVDTPWYVLDCPLADVACLATSIKTDVVVMLASPTGATSQLREVSYPLRVAHVVDAAQAYAAAKRALDPPSARRGSADRTSSRY